jgi:hypothetical protein
MKIKQMISLLLLAVAMFGIIGATAALAAGESNQKVEFGNGNYERVYPKLTMPYPGECGSDTDDIILQYSTYWGPSVNPDNVKWSSDSWFVRGYVNTMYIWGLDANGLGSTTTRVCMGKLGNALGPGGVESIYLWHR